MVTHRRFSNSIAGHAPERTERNSAQSGPSETKLDAPERTERHRDQALDQTPDHGTKIARPNLSALAERLLGAIANGAADSVTLAESLVREVLDDPVVRRARALEELLKVRSPFALVRAVELAEIVSAGRRER